MNVKILVGYHKPATLLKSDVLVPIHVGRALTSATSKDGKMSTEENQWLLNNMIGDDTGDNISAKNREFCELTALYWAWKNYDELGDPPYIGFMQYRRQLIFTKEKNKSVKFSQIEYEKITKNYIREIGIDDETILKEVEGKDGLIFAPFSYSKTVYGQFYELTFPPFDLNFSVFEKALDILKTKYPDYSESCNQYMKSYEHYWFNCFVMKKEHFFGYCDWLFSILFELEKQIDLTYETINGRRVLGYIAERLQGIFYTKNLKNWETSMYPLSFILKTDVSEENLSANQIANVRDDIHICFTSDSNYAGYLAVALISLLENSDFKKKYRIVILDDGILFEDKDLLNNMIAKYANAEIVFIEISQYITDKIKEQFYVNPDSHFTKSTYYRMLLAEIFPNLNRIIYLDCDVVVLSDISELYKIELDGHCLGATLDPEMNRLMFEQRNNQEFWRSYLVEVLGLENPYEYFQAGVLVMDLEKMRRENFFAQCIDKLREIPKPRIVDQCILNSVLCGRVKNIDLSWNVEWVIPLRRSELAHYLPADIYVNYINARKNPKIIHYCGDFKPWRSPNCELAYHFWHYARKTPFYEKILFSNIENNSKKYTIDLIKKIKNSSKIKRKYYLYSILSKVAVVGRWKRKFRKKKEHYKKEKKFLDGILK